MKPEESLFLLKLVAPQLEQEVQTTRKVIAAIPETPREYRPDPKARTAAELAWHIASTEVWFLDGLVKGKFDPADEPKQPSEVKSAADILKWYDANFPKSFGRMKALSGARLSEPISFFGVLNDPAVSYLLMLIAHSVHHRGQLSVYLRPMGGKVPSIYGGSADEPFQMG